MKAISLKDLAFLVMIFMCLSLISQIDSLEGFDENHAREHIKHVVDPKEQEKFLEQIKRNWIIRKYNLRPYQNHPENASLGLNTSKLSGENISTLQGTQPAGCNNIDFESGTTTGWTTTGMTQIVNSGIDPYGGFPRVYPGGNYSLKIGGDWTASSDNCYCTGSSVGNFCISSAQFVIPVSATNAQVSFHFAMVVYNYPHNSFNAAYVKVQLLNSNGDPLPCPNFKAYFDGSTNTFVGIPGVTPQYGPSVSGCTGNYNTTYLPWQTVNVDLSPYIGQNVIFKVDVSWCLYAVDWAYAYIDADCTSSNFAIPPACPGSNICAPAGFASYSWSIPGGGSATGQCITATTSGIYTVVCNPIISCSSPQTVTMSVVGGFTLILVL